MRALHIALLAVALLVLTGPGCALFGLDGDGFDLPVSAEHTMTLPVDLSGIPGAGQPSPMRAEIPLPIPAQPVDLASQSADLESNRDKLERLEIKRIVITPVNNTVTNALPPITLGVGPFSGAGTAFDIATIPSIPAGSTATVAAEIDDAGMDAAQQYLTTLQFSFAPTATLVVEQGDPVPSGSVDLQITLEIQATVDPTK